MMRACVALVSAVTLAACGGKTFDSLCNAVPAPEGCNKPCDPLPGAPNDCDTGYFCSPAGVCDIQCTLGGTQCGDGYACTTDGRCVNDEDAQDGPDANCPAINFTPMPVTPSIGLVLDASGSMFPNQSNYFRIMEDALVGTSGVVTQLEAKAYFGASLYTCSSQNGPLDIARIPRALNNAAAIRTAMMARNSGYGTPTHAAINDMVAGFGATPPPAGSPPVIVLATDGVPNSCSNTNGGGETATVQAARDAYAAGIPVYVLAIAQNAQHFQDVANAGQGWQPNQPNVKYYPVQNAQELKQAFDTIINGVISCDLTLTSEIDPAQASAGTVVVNGQTLTYGTDWTLVGGSTIRVLGAACDSLKATASPQVSAQFPCGSVIF